MVLRLARAVVRVPCGGTGTVVANIRAAGRDGKRATPVSDEAKGDGRSRGTPCRSLRPRPPPVPEFPLSPASGPERRVGETEETGNGREWTGMARASTRRWRGLRHLLVNRTGGPGAPALAASRSFNGHGRDLGAFGGEARVAPRGRLLFFPPTRPIRWCGGHPHTPGRGQSPLHSPSGDENCAYELCNSRADGGGA